MRLVVIVLVAALGLYIYAIVSGIQYAHRTVPGIPAGLHYSDNTLQFTSTVALTQSRLNTYNQWHIPSNPLQFPLFVPLKDLTHYCALSPAQNGCLFIDNIVVGAWRGAQVLIVTKNDQRLIPLLPAATACLQLPAIAPNSVLVRAVDGTLRYPLTGMGIRADFCQWYWKNNHSLPVYDAGWWNSTKCTVARSPIAGFTCSVDETLDLVYNDICFTLADINNSWTNCTTTCSPITYVTSLPQFVPVPPNAPVRPLYGFQPYIYFFNYTLVTNVTGYIDVTISWYLQFPIETVASINLIAVNGDPLCYPPMALQLYEWTSTATMHFAMYSGSAILFQFTSSNGYADDPWLLDTFTYTQCCPTGCAYQNISAWKPGCPAVSTPTPSSGSTSDCFPLVTDPVDLIIQDENNTASNFSYSVLLPVSGNNNNITIDEVRGLIVQLYYTANTTATVTLVALDGFPLQPPIPLPPSGHPFTITLGENGRFYSPTWLNGRVGPLLAFELFVVRTVNTANNILFHSIFLQVSPGPAFDWACPAVGPVYYQNTTAGPPRMQYPVGHTSVLLDQQQALALESAFQTTPIDQNPVWSPLRWPVQTAVAAPVTLQMTVLEFMLDLVHQPCSTTYQNITSNRFLLNPDSDNLLTPSTIVLAPIITTPNLSYLYLWSFWIQMPVAECLLIQTLTVRYCGNSLFPCTVVPPPPSKLCPLWTTGTTTLFTTTVSESIPAPDPCMHQPFQTSFTGTLNHISVNTGDLTEGTYPVNGVELECSYDYVGTQTSHTLVPTYGILSDAATVLATFVWTRRSTIVGSAGYYRTQLSGFANADTLSTVAGSDAWTTLFTLSAVEVDPKWVVTNNNLGSLVVCRARRLTPDCGPYNLLGDEQNDTQGWTITTLTWRELAAQTFAPPDALSYIAHHDPSIPAIYYDALPLTTPFFSTAVGLELLGVFEWSEMDDHDGSSYGGDEYWWVNNYGGLGGFAWAVSATDASSWLTAVSGIADPSIQRDYSLCRLLPYPWIAPAIYYFDDTLLWFLGNQTSPRSISNGTLFVTHTISRPGTDPFQIQIQYRWLYPSDLPGLLVPTTHATVMTPCDT